MTDNTKITADALLEHFHWMIDPRTDPTRTRMYEFFIDYLDSKGTEGGTVREAWQALAEADGHDPQDRRLRATFRNVVRTDHSRLPKALSRPAQLWWLAMEWQCDAQLFLRAAVREFPWLTPNDLTEAIDAAYTYMRGDLTAQTMLTHVFLAWAEFEKAKGRPEDELRLGDCVEALGIAETRADGSQYLQFNNLKRIADPELRRLTIAAAWQVQEERSTDQAAQPLTQH
jgi:hypothetical protein